MCRLLGYVCDRPTSAIDSLGGEEFQTFTALTAVHGDGWGAAWREPGTGRTRVVTSPLSAADDPDYFELADRPLGAAGILHLRWATEGLVVDPRNTHPFTDGDSALAHNGSIVPIELLEALLSEPQRARLAGDTDSERYFRLVLQCIEEDGDERAGLTRAVGTLHATFPEASLNALLLTPTTLYAVHVNSLAPHPLDDLLELLGTHDALPHGHATAYFDMAYRVTPTAVHVISSGLPDEGWTPVPADRILAVDLNSRALDVLDPRPARSGA